MPVAFLSHEDRDHPRDLSGSVVVSAGREVQP